MSRTRTTERKRVRQKEQRRRQLLGLGAMGAAIAAVLIMFLFLANQPAEAPIPEGSLTRYANVEQGLTDDDYPRLGDRDAPVEVAWYCNFDSVDCAAFHDQAIDRLSALAREEKIVLTYVPLYGQVGNSQGAARAAMCVAQQDGFWVFQDALYQWLQDYGAVQAFTNNRIVSGVTNLSLNRAEYDGCVAGGTPGGILSAAISDMNGLVPKPTIMPAVTINGVVAVDDEGIPLTSAEPILAAIDAAIAREEARDNGDADATDEPDAASTAESASTDTPSATDEPAPAVTDAPDATSEPDATPEATDSAD